MVATALTPTRISTQYPTQAGGLDTVAFVAADDVGGNTYAATGRELVIFHNTDADPHTVSITSTPNAIGRTGDLVELPIAAGEYRAAFLAVKGWRDDDGLVTVSADDATVEILVIQLP